ncbi:MAG: hypothetical protein A2542_02560 [Parcubacteria group bacterium RIFOXYD2_FULL_52_8]|nr:MAG: hypothetical protein A2542_02560 [Parcubacteria group bacterium RIFOXYD2_FULL_52_8]
MKNFQDKRTRRRLLYSHVSIAALLVVLVLLLQAVWNIYEKRKLTQVSRAHTDRELAFLQERKRSLEADIARLSSDRGSEAELRSKFQVAKPGEEVIVVLAATSSTSSVAAVGTSSKRPFFELVRSWFVK